MAKRGPKPTVTPKLKKRLVVMLRVGMSLSEARRALGLSEAAVRRERHQDQKFDAGVKKAAWRGKARHLLRIDRGDERWQSSAWFLERKYGAEYGQRMKVEPGSGPLVVKVIGGAASLEDL